jgi:hypothetical protein
MHTSSQHLYVGYHIIDKIAPHIFAIVVSSYAPIPTHIIISTTKQRLQQGRHSRRYCGDGIEVRELDPSPCPGTSNCCWIPLTGSRNGTIMHHTFLNHCGHVRRRSRPCTALAPTTYCRYLQQVGISCRSCVIDLPQS